MAGPRHWWKALAALLALVGAGTVAAVASAPSGDGWRADPDEQFMLDVSLRRLKLGDGVRAYATPTGPCIVFGDFLNALDVPLTVDLDHDRASGWAFSQEHQIVIDKAAHTATIKGKRESFARTDVRDTPEGWCVASDALSRWFGIRLEAKTGIALLQVESEQKLPVELALDRRQRAAQLKRKASIETADLPRVSLPYRLWRAPALEFMVSAGATYSARTGFKVDRTAAVAGAGEVAAMSYSFRVTSGRKPIETVRATVYRSDPDATLLGPLHATHFALGDVEGVRSDFGGGSAVGRGAIVTNEPLNHRSNFDRTSFSGELPAGWDAELYRNDSLVAFADGKDGDGLYHFDDIEMLYGENRFEIVLYGPQGQIQRREETVNVGQENVPRGKFWYWAGVRQPNTPLFSVGKPPGAVDGTTIANARSPSRAPDAAVEARYGVSERLSVGALVRSLEVQDERLTYVEGSIRYSLGRALGEVAAARDTRGGMAVRAQIATKIGAVSVNAATQWSKNFAPSTDDSGQAIKAEHRLGVVVPLKLGKTALPISGDVKMIERLDGSRELDAATRLSARIGGFNLASETTYRKRLGGPPDSESKRVDTALIASGHIGAVRLRGAALFKIEPEQRFDRAELNAYWSANETTDFEAGVAYTAESKRMRGRLSYIRRFEVVALAVTGEAASDGSVAAGINLNFALDPFRGNLRPTRDRLATTGLVKARVFEDLNENGRRDSGEPVAEDAIITTGMKLAERPTGKDGTATVGGLAPYVPVAIGIDQSSLANPALTPAKPAQVVVPRPGVAATVDIALVGGGSVEGFAAKDDGTEFEGLELQLVTPDGEVVATTMSDIDGYFLFERVRYGQYRLRLAPATAKAVGAPADVGAGIAIDRDKPLGRMGVVRVLRAPSLAMAGSGGGDPKSSETTFR